jgi:hypothetical protein
MNDIAYLLESTRPRIEPLDPEWSAQTLASIMSTPTASPGRAGRRLRRPVARLTALGAGAATIAAVVVGATSIGSSPAFAVEQQTDGDIVVTVHRLTDAAGLENALSHHGIRAEVTYVGVKEPSDLSNGHDVPCVAGQHAGATVDPTDDGGFSVTFEKAYLAAHRGAEVTMIAAGGRNADDFAAVKITWSDGLC